MNTIPKMNAIPKMNTIPRIRRIDLNPVGTGREVNSRMRSVVRQVALLFLVIIVALGSVPAATVRAQEDGPLADEVARLMERMSSAAKVGQLFVVTFPGSEVADDADIAELIRDYHIGGVVLKPENGNIINVGNTPQQVTTLVNQLQTTAWRATQPVTGTVPEPFIPLFVATSHEGNGMPHTSIVSGTTPLPSQMALGATWNISHTLAVGRVAGQELRALGINMLLGPSLDVLENPRPTSSGDLGVRTFGGDPFWVGQMGKAYIRGVHEGSSGRVAVVAKHFPGLGSSDRSLDEEISTVQRTLEKLKQVDLAPFFTVAQAQNPLARPEGIVVSHIRFQGLGGGRFITTLPISVDSNVLQQLLTLPEMATWRESGGVTLSDELGLRALRRFYAPGEQAFNGRRIAQDAFLAGNDLLFLSQFGLSGQWADQLSNVESTITFFRDKYESEPSFQKQVDEAVARILRLKLSLSGGAFSLDRAKPNASVARETTQPGVDAVSAVARDALTLLSPPSPDLVPAPPTREDRIVIFTDARDRQRGWTPSPCTTCEPLPYVDPQALESTFVQFYGPDATGQVDPQLISSFTFSELEAYLNAPPAAPAVSTATPTAIPPTGEAVTPTAAAEGAALSPPGIDAALQDVDWVIFGMLNPNDGPPQADVVKRFLAERADALQDPHVVVMAYDVPYCLDATEISKLSAYYAAYSHLTPFIKASVRALFGEFAPQGAPPVSIAGISYDLLTQTSPDPEQTIPVMYSVIKPDGEEEGTPTPTPSEQQPTVVGATESPAVAPTEEGQPTDEAEPTAGAPAAETRLEKGDQLRLRTGKIVDHNGHVVPDGTPVQFIFNYPQEGLEQSMLVTTRDGFAEAVTTLDRTGRLDISVQADPVPRKVALQITIQEGGAATIVTPTPSPTPLPTPTPTPTATPAGGPPADGPARATPRVDSTPTASPTAVATPVVVVEQPEPPSGVDVQFWDLLIALIGAVVVGGAGYYAMRLGDRTVTRALRVGLWGVIGGLAVYVIYVVSLSYLGLFDGPGVDPGQREAWGFALAGGAALAGSSTALLFAWFADRRRWARDAG
jgi:beta-N-acetylhexosaminidase